MIGRYECPKCRSEFAEATYIKEEDILQLHCHKKYGSGCGYEWTAKTGIATSDDKMRSLMRWSVATGISITLLVIVLSWVFGN